MSANLQTSYIPQIKLFLFDDIINNQSYLGDLLLTSGWSLRTCVVVLLLCSFCSCDFALPTFVAFIAFGLPEFSVTGASGRWPMVTPFICFFPILACSLPALLLISPGNYHLPSILNIAYRQVSWIINILLTKLSWFVWEFLTSVVRTDLTVFGLYSCPSSRFSHTDLLLG